MIPALVLAAGLGTRLDPLTRLVAKAAVPMAGRTLIERSLDFLRRQGVRDVVVNLHHRPDTITSVVGDGAHRGVRVRYSWEPVVLGSAGGPRRALPLLDAETFLVVNGDTLSDVAIDQLVARHARTGADATMAVVPNPAPDHYNGVLVDEEDRVEGFVPKGLLSGTWHFIGVQVVRAQLFAGLTDGVPAETVGAIYRDRVATAPGSIRAWRADTAFQDVGTPRDYLRAALELAAAESGAANAIEPGAAVDPRARIARSVVWADARIDAGADLQDSVVAGAVHLRSGFRARHAIILPAHLVAPNDVVEIEDGAAVFAS